MVERAAGLPATCLPVAQSALDERLGPILGEAAHELLEQRAKLRLLGSGETLENAVEARRAPSKDSLHRLPAPRGQEERSCATVPPRATLDELMHPQAVEQPDGSRLRQAKDSPKRLDGLAGIRIQMNEGRRRGTAERKFALYGGSEPVGRRERGDTEEVREPLVHRDKHTCRMHFFSA